MKSNKRNQHFEISKVTKRSSWTNPILPQSFPERDSNLEYIAKALDVYIDTFLYMNGKKILRKHKNGYKHPTEETPKLTYTINPAKGAKKSPLL